MLISFIILRNQDNLDYFFFKCIERMFTFISCHLGFLKLREVSGFRSFKHMIYAITTCGL